MTPLVLTLRGHPDQRLDMSALVPQKLAGKSIREIERIEIQTTRERVTLGDAFKIRKGNPAAVRLNGGSDRLDRIAAEMSDGEIIVEGDVGQQAGRQMKGGRLLICGSAGPWAASGMGGGTIEIGRHAGERLAGPLNGETAGMRGGLVIVRGNAGEHVGDRLRRGTIIVEGHAGRFAGSRMIAGTIILVQSVGAMPGTLMCRGTIVMADKTCELLPTFSDCGRQDLVFARIMASALRPVSARVAALIRRPLRRLAGDMAALGKGEIWLVD
jgi:formylmethanofuran dehydrogenase subunit C